MTSHIEPPKAYVRALLQSAISLWVPYFAPIHGGINARALSVLRDPGPVTQRETGSGFISIENDDPLPNGSAIASSPSA
ncbi:hypothetical protein [Cryobacterium sp. Y82]|uniref:hypothetical protein n=1 Tax=Cryobacterium sp. Y82 TaxID=2045017 RepID=UPI000CE30912|nr:hypothetical protein [Cryobacterium sp. Y82]